MLSLNLVLIGGNLGADPEVRTTGSGTTVANIRVAVNSSFKNSTTGEKQKHTEWFSVTLWGRQAEIARDYLKKGSEVMIQGRQKTESWQDGTETRYKVTVVGEKLTLGSRPDASRQPPASDAAPQQPRPSNGGGNGNGARHNPPQQSGQDFNGGDVGEFDIPF